MDARTTGMFRELLHDQMNSLLKEAASTVEGMAEGEKETFPDPTDRATIETNRNFTLRIRDRERRLIVKIKEAIGLTLARERRNSICPQGVLCTSSTPGWGHFYKGILL